VVLPPPNYKDMYMIANVLHAMSDRIPRSRTTMTMIAIMVIMAIMRMVLPGYR